MPPSDYSMTRFSRSSRFLSSLVYIHFAFFRVHQSLDGHYRLDFFQCLHHFTWKSHRKKHNLRRPSQEDKMKNKLQNEGSESLLPLSPILERIYATKSCVAIKIWMGTVPTVIMQIFRFKWKTTSPATE